MQTIFKVKSIFSTFQYMLIKLFIYSDTKHTSVHTLTEIKTGQSANFKTVHITMFFHFNIYLIYSGNLENCFQNGERLMYIALFIKVFKKRDLKANVQICDG